MTGDDVADLQIAAFVGGAGVEGGLNGHGEPTTTWHQAEALGLVEPTGVGVALYTDPEPLASAAARLGVSEILLRLEWARLEPSEGRLDRGALDRYGALLATFRGAGLGTRIVLGDGVLPAWLGVEGWLLPGTPERFGRLAAEIVDVLGPSIDGVITLEAPAELAVAGWAIGVAPPFRTGAALDALAALDGMLSAHLLACAALERSAPGLERSLLPSERLLGDLEAALLDPAEAEWPTEVASWLADRTPSRAKQLGAEGPGSTAGWVVLGRGARAGTRLRGTLFDLGIGLGGFDLDQVVAALEAEAARRDGGPIHVALRSVVAEIDAEGRHAPRGGRARLEDLVVIQRAVTEAGARGIDVRSVVGGELVDRWRWGSYTQREGLIGVDRLRGDRGFRLLSTDAAGVDVATALRGLDEELAPRRTLAR